MKKTIIKEIHSSSTEKWNFKP